MIKKILRGLFRRDVRQGTIITLNFPDPKMRIRSIRVDIISLRDVEFTWKEWEGR